VNVQASTITQVNSNNSPATALSLTAGQFVVSGAMDADAGRPDTLLGEYDPTYTTLLASDDNSNPFGDHKGSELLGLPLRANGSAYFRITGTGDTAFDGNQTQLGRYSVEFDIRDPLGNLVKTLPLTYKTVYPGMIGNVWVNPDLSKANWTGYTVDVIVNNIIGPGTGTSLEFYTFNGLQPGQHFSAQIAVATFSPLIGVFNSSGQLISMGTSPTNGFSTVSGTANSLGQALIGVTGQGDNQFHGAHADVGTFTLDITTQQVPEPSSAVLVGLGGTLACMYWQWRRRRAA
jgi:hypothetical protein